MKAQIVLGMEVLGIGFSVVFLSLFVLYLILLLFGKILSEENHQKKAQKKETQSVSHLTAEEDTEVVAVINAAVTAYLISTSSPEAVSDAFLPVLREGNKSKWSANARLYLLQSGRELSILRRRK